MRPKALARLSPPGALTDLSGRELVAWSERVSQMLDEAIAGDPRQFEHNAPRRQFFNPAETEIADDAQRLPIFWFAFPRTVTMTTRTDRERWDAADADRDLQDEYCEWAVRRRDNDGKIVRVTFTTETTEYWDQLAQNNEERLLGLYRQFLGRNIPLADIFGPDGRYNPRNKWNSRTDVGPIHLVQQSNFLSAAIELAAAATIVRKIDGRLIVSDQELIRCSQYGVPVRNSDPHIGAQINELARMKADVTLADPIGIYILGVSTAGWQTPDGADPQDFWIPVRGARRRRVRCVFEVPQNKPYVVGDILIQGRPIEFGAQIADFVTIMLCGVACRFGQSIVQPMTDCARARGAASAEAGLVGESRDVPALGVHGQAGAMVGVRADDTTVGRRGRAVWRGNGLSRTGQQSGR